MPLHHAHDGVDLRLLERRFEPDAAHRGAVLPRGLDDVEAGGAPRIGVVEHEALFAMREPVVEREPQTRKRASPFVTVETPIALLDPALGKRALSRSRVADEENDFAVQALGSPPGLGAPGRKNFLELGNIVGGKGDVQGVKTCGLDYCEAQLDESGFDLHNTVFYRTICTYKNRTEGNLWRQTPSV